jgi:hypothetical protein
VCKCYIQKFSMRGSGWGWKACPEDIYDLCLTKKKTYKELCSKYNCNTIVLLYAYKYNYTQ